MIARQILLIAFTTFLITAPITAQDTTSQKVKQILQTRCYYCHGEDGAAEGGINFLLDYDRLVAKKYIIPGEPLKSRLYRQVALDDMPKDDKPLTNREKQLIKSWIEDGALSFNPPAKARDFIGPLQVYEFLAADIMAQKEEVRRHMRYFNITHLYNAGISEYELETYRRGLSKLLNSLSWGKDINVPEAIDPAKTIFRIDMRHYKWDEATWNQLAAANPYQITYKFPEVAVVNRETGTLGPNLPVNWFVATASVPPLYHQLLKLPDKVTVLEFDLFVNVQRNIDENRIARAGFTGSGVSGNNRVIERHESKYGAYWKSYDFKAVGGIVSTRNLFDRPLGPGGNQGFAHDGGEVIFSLPNGLQGYMLIDKAGNRIEKGPIDIVQDNKRPDRQVVNGLSCMSCHVRGIITKQDQIRPTVLANQMAYEQSLGKNGVEKILGNDLEEGIYPKQEELDRLFREDRDRFAAAVEETGGRVTDTEPIVMLALQFEQEVDLALAAAEAGLPAKEFSRRLKATPDLARALGRILVDGGTITRETYRTFFPTMVPSLRLDLPETLADPQAVMRPAKIQVFEGGPEFVLIPAGKFMMGGLIEGKEGDHPPHEVEITKPFYLAVGELTRAELRAIGVNRRIVEIGNAEEHDVVLRRTHTVSAEVRELISGINRSERMRLSGFRARLPTEAEWEYAARGGHQNLSWLEKGEKFSEFESRLDIGVGSKRTVGNRLKKPNPFGLFDMLGVNAEPVSDYYDPNFYKISPKKDPRGPAIATNSHVQRGSISEQLLRRQPQLTVEEKINYLVIGRRPEKDQVAIRLVLEFVEGVGGDEKKEE
jgi:formylglycine-generating enzyme required for sulfatase activity